MAFSQQPIVQVVLLVVAFGVPAVDGELPFSLGSCARNRNRELLTFAGSSVSPYPLVLPGNFSVTSSLRVFRNVTGDITLDFSIKRHFGFFWLEIPCFRGVGSCQYPDVCGLLRDAFGTNAGCPPQFRRHGVPCTCPMSPGIYTMTNGVFHVADLSTVWRWLVRGDYRVKARLLDNRSGEEIACQRMYITVDSPCTGFFCHIFG